MPLDKFDYESILRVLARHGVDFIVIGGVCANMHGAPLLTFDLDIVHDRKPDNLERLAAALKELRAYYWEHLNKRLEPEIRTMALPGHHLLDTDAGRLDLIGTVVGGKGYDELLSHTVLQQLDAELQVRLLDLPTLIEIKEATGRDKDKLAAMILKQTLLEVQEEI